MKIFIGTADAGQIREAWSWGIIDGVTTTVNFHILQQLCQHPLTDSVLEMFLKDWAKAPKA